MAQIKERLEKLKREIERKIRGLERVPELGEGPGEDIESHESEEYGKQLSIAQILKGRLIAINKALWKFKKKKYGICEKCGKKIEPELLNLVLESELCKNCKKQAK